jgi:hypothetical protein
MLKDFVDEMLRWKFIFNALLDLTCIGPRAGIGISINVMDADLQEFD